jgi:hypothetical protein
MRKNEITKSDAVLIKATGVVGVVVEVLSAKRVVVSLPNRTTYVFYKTSLVAV